MLEQFGKMTQMHLYSITIVPESTLPRSLLHPHTHSYTIELLLTAPLGVIWGLESCPRAQQQALLKQDLNLQPFVIGQPPLPPSSAVAYAQLSPLHASMSGFVTANKHIA